MACRSKRAKSCMACMRPVAMLNYNACPNSSAAFTKGPTQAAQLSTRLPVPPRRGLRDQYFCSYGPVSDLRCGIENDKFTSQIPVRSEEHTSELQSRQYLVCRLLLEKT